VTNTCKTCGRPLADSLSWLWDECEPCRAKRDRKHMRMAGCFLVPLWLPFWAAGNLIGLAFGVFWKGMDAGIDSVKRFTDAWKHKEE